MYDKVNSRYKALTIRTTVQLLTIELNNTSEFVQRGVYDLYIRKLLSIGEQVLDYLSTLGSSHDVDTQLPTLQRSTFRPSRLNRLNDHDAIDNILPRKKADGSDAPQIAPT